MGCQRVDPDSIKRFLASGSRELRLLLWRTRQTLAEITQAIWVYVLELEREWGRPVDIRGPGDRAEIFRRVEREYAKDRRKNPGALSLDAPRSSGDESGTASWIDSLRAGEESDPVELIIREQEHAQRTSKIAELCALSYSQFTAYLILLFHLELKGAASRLAITPATLSRRVAKASVWSGIQPSLFDRIARLTLDFMPPPGVAFPKRRTAPGHGVQICLELI